MADTKIEMKVDEEIKPLKELCEKMTEIVKMEVAKGVDKIDTKELGYAIDMIKDLADAKAKTVEALYHKQIMGAMEENADEYGETWDEEGRIGRGYNSVMHPRSARTGRYIQKSYIPEMYNDTMPMMMGYSHNSNGNIGGNTQMSYNDGYSKGYEDGKMSNQVSMSRYDRARKGYMDAKANRGMTDADKQMKAKELDKMMNELTEDMKELVVGMSPEEKTVWKHKIQKWNDMVQ